MSYSLLPHPKKHNKSNVCQGYQQPLDDIVMGQNSKSLNSSFLSLLPQVCKIKNLAMQVVKSSYYNRMPPRQKYNTIQYNTTLFV